MKDIDWAKVEEVFSGALELDPASRAEYLDTACGGDAGLRGEIESLLDSHTKARAGGFTVEFSPDGEVLSTLHKEFLVGQKLDRFLIQGYLGEGGMGEVYKALDTRLGRTVAIKLAAHRFSGRVEREARAIAALNHPNICTLHDVGPNYLVMELIEGETLAARIAAGPILEPEAFELARQIAAALDAAHEKGIVHRDLKPANLKITPAGVVKVLDFGLARGVPAVDEQIAPTGGGAEASVAGTILGTVAYMSPEQAEGKDADRRADVWAFGVVLYEMLTQARPFQAADTPGVIRAILQDDPDLGPLPIHIRPVVSRCLQKDPRKRWHSAGDAVLALELSTANHGLRRLPRVAQWVTAAAVVAAAGMGSLWLWRLYGARADRPLMRLSVDLPNAIFGVRIGAEGQAASGDCACFALSPGDDRLVFSSRGRGGVQQLSVRHMGQAEDFPLPGTEGAFDPFFSPDGTSIGFFANSKLKTTPSSGGSVTTLSDALAPRGAAWGEDGYIVLNPRGRGGLFRIPAKGGNLAPLTQPVPGKEMTHRWPQVLPGGKAVLFTAHVTASNYDNANIEAVTIESGKRTTVVQHGYYGRYLPGGYLVYVHDGVLYGVRFDPARLQTQGTPAALLDDLTSDSGTAAGGFDFSRDGVLVYANRKVVQAWPVMWLARSGVMEPLLAQPGAYATPRFSPDGQKVAYALTGKGPDLYVYELKSGKMTRLTFNGQENSQPVWAPDGKHIAFKFDYPGGYAIGWMSAEGGEVQRLLERDHWVLPSSFSPDGTRLAYHEQGGLKTNSDLWILPLDRSDPDHPRPQKPEMFLGTAASEWGPVFAPDGRWIAYASNESGRNEAYVQAYPARGAAKRISMGGGGYPIWSRVRQELFYETPENQIMSVSYTIRGGTFEAREPQLWSDERLLSGLTSNLDLAPAGGRFAILPRVSARGAGRHLEVTVLMNFFDEVRRRVH